MLVTDWGDTAWSDATAAQCRAQLESAWSLVGRSGPGDVQRALTKGAYFVGRCHRGGTSLALLREAWHLRHRAGNLEARVRELRRRSGEGAPAGSPHYRDDLV